MSCVHVVTVEVEWVHALSCLRRSFRGLDPSRIAVCWSRPGAKVISTKSAGNAEDGRVREGG